MCPVSILVLLDVALKDRRRTDVQYPRYHVSILVLLDVALKDCFKFSHLLTKRLFQSLFSWMLLWKEIEDDYLRVVWEFQSLFSWMLLWKVIFPSLSFTTICFNPCSLGCCSERLIGSPVHIPPARFNPCSLGCCSESRRVLHIRSVCSEFQSLFSWMLLWKLGRRWPPIHPIQFQSLFSWMLLWKKSGRYHPASPRSVSILVLLDVALKGETASVGVRASCSFNPCSLGCCSESYDPKTGIHRPNEFQSLFSWMLLWKVPWLSRWFWRKRFQSLFSWMLLWKQFNACESSDKSGKFQSLFSWMLLWKQKSIWDIIGLLIVSILVLLDVALKVCCRRADQLGHPCFNPCSLGCCSES